MSTCPHCKKEAANPAFYRNVLACTGCPQVSSDKEVTQVVLLDPLQVMSRYDGCVDILARAALRFVKDIGRQTGRGIFCPWPNPNPYLSSL